ncbi:apolipoprotein N-acyltransferase [Flavobacteriaceae bacterium UJ101]|nr:apolipoprotein N-acyltransferase [Flavobacteriaceae bacterium UJ101]
MKTPYYFLLAIFSGLLLGFAWPTTGFPLLLFIAFIPLLWIEYSITSNKKLNKKGWYVFSYAYIAFLIWNLLAVGWLSNLQPAIPAFPIAVGFNALFMALVFWMFYYFKKKLGNGYGYTFLPLVWIAFEKLHLNWSISFPWLNLGNGFASYHTWVQWYEYTGVFGGTLWVWIVNLGLFFALKDYVKTKEIEHFLKKIIVQVFIIIFPILISLFIYNSYDEQGDGVKITVLQPNLDVYEEKFRISKDQMTDELLELAEESMDSDTDYVIAPETSILGVRGIELNKAEYNPQIQKVENFVKKHPNTLFLGGTTFHTFTFNKDEISPYSNKLSGIDQDVWVDRYNSAFQIGNQEQFQVYHKSKLVIGVETIPFHTFLKPLMENVLIDLGGTVSTHTPQEKRTNFTNSKNNFRPGVAICYESVYGEFVTEYVKNGANLLFIITNDGWWGNSEGHKQHLAYAKLRAIENRRSIARSANTGVSAFINQKGDIISRLEYDTKGALNEIILTNEKLTFYSKYGDVIVRTVLFLVGIFFAILFSNMILTKKKTNTHK